MRRPRTLEEALLEGGHHVELSIAADLAEERGEEGKARGLRILAGWASQLHSAFCVAEFTQSRVAGFVVAPYNLLVMATHHRTVSRVVVFKEEGGEGEHVYLAPFTSGKSRGVHSTRMKMGLETIWAAFMWERERQRHGQARKVERPTSSL